MSEPIADDGTGQGSSVFTRRLGAFPLWVWMGLGLAGLLVWTDYSKNKKAAAQAQQTTLPTTQTASGSEPASLIPQFVNQVYENPTPPVVNVSQNVNPTTPVTVPVTVNNPAPPAQAPPPPPQAPPPPPAAPPPPPPPAGQWVTVAKWTAGNAPWNSTLWGIAQHFYGNGAEYGKIYQANATGVMRPDGSVGAISNPNLIYPNERIWVPA